MSSSRPIGAFRSRGSGSAGPADVVAHLGDELVPAGVDGLDDPLRLPVVADRAAGSLDPRREGRLRHEPVTPDRVEQLLLRHDPVAVDDQMAEQLEHLRLDVHRPGRPGQREPLVVQLELPEPEPHAAMMP